MSDDSRIGNRITYKVIGDAVDRYNASEWAAFKSYQEKRGDHPYFRKR